MNDGENTAVSVEDFLVPAEETQDTTDTTEAVTDDAPLSEEAFEPDASEEVEQTEEEVADEETETGEPEVEAVPAPNSWSKEDAKVWETLPPEAQAVVARREQERDRFVREAGRKAAETKTQVENQAREILAQQAEDHSIALQAYAQQFQPQAPDQRLLYTGNPDDVLTYQRQDAAYRAAASQQQQLQQAIAQAQQQARAAREQVSAEDIRVETERLQEQLPDWFDPSAGPKLKAELQSIGAELGYPAELMAQAGATDIIALNKAREWKVKAEKLDRIMSKQMAQVRAAKGKPPQMSRPGAPGGKGVAAMRSQADRDAAIQSFGQTRSGEAAAALLLTRTR